MLVRKQINPPNFESRASASDVARSAIIGALALGIIGLLLALMVGAGAIPVGGLSPDFEPDQTGTTLSLTIITTLIGAVTGAILGAALQLRASPDQAEITSEGVIHSGLLLVVNADKTQTAAARKMMEASGAADIEHLDEKWDPQIWSRYEGIETSPGS